MLLSGLGGVFNPPRSAATKRAAASFLLKSSLEADMAKSIIPPFVTYPNEGSLIGRLVAGYGELEFELANCVAAVVKDTNTAMRTVFRIRGEDARILTVDALIRPSYYSAGLTDQYNEMIGAYRWCKKTRNQFAHCHWAAHKTKGLYFTDLEKPMAPSVGPIILSWRHVDVPLLEKQEEYFRYTFDWLQYLSNEYGHRVLKEPIHSVAIPKIIAPPSRHNPPEKHGSPLRD